MRRIASMSSLVRIVCIAQCLCGATISYGGVIYNISMSTSPVNGHPAGPFSLEFQFNDGSGAGDANNTAILSNFLFNGGSAVGSPTLTGGATGNLASGLTLTDSSFFNQFIQTFTPGSTLSFMLSLTTNLDGGGTPDEFTFAILDNTGTEIPTSNPNFFDVFVQIDIDSLSPSVGTFATDANRSPTAGGLPIDIAAPAAISVSSVPEPTTFSLLAGVLGIMLAVRHRKRS